MRFVETTTNNNNNNNEILECNELDNDILFRKYPIKKNIIIVLKEKQFICIVENGKILDIEDIPGRYKIEIGNTDKKNFAETWKNIVIRKSENIPLSVIFINRKNIKQNKYFINRLIKYKDYNNEIKEIYIKISGTFDFYIDKPDKFLKKVIGLRNHFSKQELIEQTRNYIIKSIEKEVSDILERNNLNINILKTKSKNLKLFQNQFDEKLFEYGIKINCFNIDEIELVNKKRNFLNKR